MPSASAAVRGSSVSTTLRSHKSTKRNRTDGFSILRLLPSFVTQRFSSRLGKFIRRTTAPSLPSAPTHARFAHRRTAPIAFRRAPIVRELISSNVIRLLLFSLLSFSSGDGISRAHIHVYNVRIIRLSIRFTVFNGALHFYTVRRPLGASPSASAPARQFLVVSELSRAFLFGLVPIADNTISVPVPINTRAHVHLALARSTPRRRLSSLVLTECIIVIPQLTIQYYNPGSQLLLLC